jgi:hypothetical protein
MLTPEAEVEGQRVDDRLRGLLQSIPAPRLATQQPPAPYAPPPGQQPGGPAQPPYPQPPYPQQ